ncbi:hypothetical protein SAY87_000636 [Trapa incisa]|uniref:Symplekin n=1 Tax=Trapa incisa TaxID=236973 RepID=A0AAN7GH75_9MYRT|nr:hypothetical protein SAY87_000636 [Trapa incisa]
MASRDQALSLLAAANNHGDLAVKLSSLRQVKDILLSVDASFASELFPYLAGLQSSPQSLVRKSLVEIVEEIGLKAMEHAAILMPVLLTLVRDADQVVASQSIISGTKLFSSVLEEMTMQMHRLGRVERWFEDLWMWMVKFKDIVLTIMLEVDTVRTRMMALKFLETFVLLFSPDNNDYRKPVTEGRRHVFNVSWIVGGHPILDPVVYIADARRIIGVLFDLLKSSPSLPGCLTITLVNCLAAIARKRPQYFNTISSLLLDFKLNFQTTKDFHAPSVQYSLRTAFLGFLRCAYSPVIESRERLLRALRAMNAGDAAEQVIRQVDKHLRGAERVSHDFHVTKDDELATKMLFTGDFMKRRRLSQSEDDLFYNNHEMLSKKTRYGPNTISSLPVQTTDLMNGSLSMKEPPSVPVLDTELTPAEQMIAIIGALLAEGERGAESLELLITKMHPDMLADIVITNMKHLPKVSPPLIRVGSSQAISQVGSPSLPSHISASPGTENFLQSQVPTGQLPNPSVCAISTMPSATVVSNITLESRRDPRRDPRRHDPRLSLPAEIPSTPNMEQPNAMKSDWESSSLSKPLPSSVAISSKTPSGLPNADINTDEDMLEYASISETNKKIPEVAVFDDAKDSLLNIEVNIPSDLPLSPRQLDDNNSIAVKVEVMEQNEIEMADSEELEEYLPTVTSPSVIEDTVLELPSVPSYVELTSKQESNLLKLSVMRIIESYKNLNGKDCEGMRISLIARLVAQIEADDDIIVLLQRHILEDYQLQKGHELVLHILYHLHSLAVANSVMNSAEIIYEKFLLSMAKSLLDHFPASDKSFSRLLGEAPFLPSSLLKLLDDLCYLDVSDDRGTSLRDANRVAQGLGTAWSLIVGRPHYRESCLDIALKCAVHSQEEIRSKSIRLVANKLYQLSYISDAIEQFAQNMLLSAIDQNVLAVGKNILQPGGNEQPEVEICTDKTSLSGSEVSETATSETESTRDTQAPGQSSSVSLLDAQRLISLFFALCAKKPNLLYVVFDTYGRAPKTVKQTVHRHIPILLRALGSSCSELLQVISDPPQGSENLLTLVLQILTDEAVPSPDLIATVKHLYETKLKDVSILIPMLPSLSKNEVLPIFPRLLDLHPEKFQKALAHILQGSAHSGPALTPAEVLIAIHDIVPEKDSVPLKKAMDACSACFEQRTVFTQQVLAKALNQMVDQTPLPLLFMRTVIQAIDAFPTLVDFVMELLSKLVIRQIWKMPKLYVGFLKCVAQTQPHSFHVLLQLPPPQLESFLSKYPHLRGPLTDFASQSSIRASLPRSTLSVLELATESNSQQPHHSSPLPPDTSSSIRGATMT